MEEDKLDYLLAPLGLLMLALYHVWLLFTILKHPTRTIIGLNAESRHQWVFSMMSDPLKNGVLAVQTIRNNIMASTLLATIAITLSSLISVFVSSSSDSGNATSEIVYGNKSPLLSSIKYFSILLCFLVAFLCNVQSIRYYAHVSFLVTLPSSIDNMESVEYVARNLNRGSFFWSLGLRAFYLSFPLLLWIFGPIPMFLCCCMMSFLLYFLDTTSSFTRQLHRHSFNEEMLKAGDLESIGQTLILVTDPTNMFLSSLGSISSLIQLFPRCVLSNNNWHSCLQLFTYGYGGLYVALKNKRLSCVCLYI
ncbi:uncharacterized protein LOC111289258 isoform X1 [Durio zibethinus]|uniref:Uncharacterized protein LOC111289258 isoform X1 n=1 Tax=Durio zibethinus TaxID=66656 RepID=A0A6P5Y646_DURZI|nr:uncharacterized protein LOC111289258 isoform X1 [Durio zibethinus]